MARPENPGIIGVRAKVDRVKHYGKSFRFPLSLRRLINFVRRPVEPREAS